MIFVLDRYDQWRYMLLGTPLHLGKVGSYQVKESRVEDRTREGGREKEEGGGCFSGILKIPKHAPGEKRRRGGLGF